MEQNTHSTPQKETMPYMTLENIARACGGVYHGAAELLQREVTGIVTDSRQAEEGSLFVAIKGERVDGHRFIPAVFEQGAMAVLCEDAPQMDGCAYIQVPSTLEAIKKIAAFYRSALDIPVVGVIGSVGKTSTKEMIASVLSQKYSVLKTDGNFNNEIGVPLTIFRIRKEHQVAVLEMGISDFGEMDRLADIAKPDICVMTNIGWCHLENLKTRDGILKAKTECFAHMREGGTAILNGDDDKLSTQQSVCGRRPVFYGIPEKMQQAEPGSYEKDPQVYAKDVENLGFEGMKATICTPSGSFAAEISIPGEHNVYNALAAAAVGITLGLSMEQIAKGIAEAKTIAGRTNFIRHNGMIIIDDCYNANPVSTKAALDLLSLADGRKVAVLGDMFELGEKERELHGQVGAYAAEQGIDCLYCAGNLSKEMYRAAKEAGIDCVEHFADTDALLAALPGLLQPGDSVLIKASHGMGYAKIVEALEK